MSDREIFTRIFNKLRSYLNASSDAAIARGMEITPQALNKFKKQGKFPADLIIDFCLKHNLSVDDFYQAGTCGQEAGSAYGNELATLWERIMHIYQHGCDDQKTLLYGQISRVYDGILNERGKQGDSGDTDRSCSKAQKKTSQPEGYKIKKPA